MRFSKKNFYSVKISPHLFGITKPNDTLNRFGDEEKAIRIATQKMYEHRMQGKDKPSAQIPGTTVHLLVDEIKSKINQKEK